MITFTHSQLKRNLILGVAFDDKSILFGIDFSLKVLEFKLGEEIFVSRSWYDRDPVKFYTQTYRGRKLVVPEPDQERDIIRRLIDLPSTYRSPDLDIDCELILQSQNLCKRCKGKGLTDWIEELTEPSLHIRSRFNPAEMSMTFSSMSKNFIQYEFPNNISVFYRDRILDSDYLRGCCICPACHGVGVERFPLDSELPLAVVEQIKIVVEKRLKAKKALIASVA
jgi:hypothetical protein